MNNTPFTIAQMRPIREAMTISRPARLGAEVPVTWFSMGAGTSITPESYDCTTLYLGLRAADALCWAQRPATYPLPPVNCWYCPPKRCAAPWPTATAPA